MVIVEPRYRLRIGEPWPRRPSRDSWWRRGLQCHAAECDQIPVRSSADEGVAHSSGSNRNAAVVWLSGFAAGVATTALCMTVLWPNRHAVYTWVFACWRHRLAGFAVKDQEIILNRRGFTVCYSPDALGPCWASLFMSRWSVATRATSVRPLHFSPDRDVPAQVRINPSAFTTSGYDRGHLAPFAALRWNAVAAEQSFLMSNVTPQVPYVNRVIMRAVEHQLRRWARQHGKLAVCVGCSYHTKRGSPVKMACGTLVPSHFFVAATICRSPTHPMIGFWIPNVEPTSTRGQESAVRAVVDLEPYVVSIDKLERLSGQRFFCQLPLLYRVSWPLWRNPRCRPPDRSVFSLQETTLPAEVATAPPVGWVPSS